MDKNPESAKGESVIFDMNLEIQEDVDACLAEFVFLVRLYLHEDARHMAEQILWRHIGYFPVFAELAAFFIVIRDRQAASDLIIDLAARSIVFAGEDEQQFLQMVALFAKYRLSASTLAAFFQEGELKLQRPPFTEIDYNSVAQLQNVEIRLYDILVIEQHGKLLDVVVFAIDHIKNLIDFSLLREATEIFSYLCIYFHNHGLKYDIESLYSNLSEMLEQRRKTLKTNEETKDVLLNQMTAKTALLVALRGKVQPPPAVDRSKGIDELVHDIEDSTNILFSMVVDKKPALPLVDRLYEHWHVQEHPPFLEEGVSFQRKLDIPNAARPDNTKDKGLQPSDKIQIFGPTGEVLISEPTGRVFVHIPREETYINEPREAVHIQYPQESVYVQSPQETVYVQAPEQVTYVQKPQEAVYVQWPKQITYVQQPQDTVYVQASEQVTYVQNPQETVYVQAPQQVTYIQEPQETVYVQAPVQVTYVQEPQETVYVQQPKGPLNIHAPENETKVAESRGPLHIYQPEGDVYIYASKAQVHLYDPAASIHIHKQNDEIHVYEPESDARVNAPHSSLHTHDELDGGIPDAEQEPLPPYTAEYKIPETIVLDQMQKLREMEVIQSIVKKLPDPPEYTGPISNTEIMHYMGSQFSYEGVSTDQESHFKKRFSGERGQRRIENETDQESHFKKRLSAERGQGSIENVTWRSLQWNIT